MIDFATSFLTWTATTLIPAFVGLVVITAASRIVQARYLAGFAFGIFLWFFVDTIGGAGNLGNSLGFGGGLGQVVLVLLFIVGLLIFVALDRSRNIFAPESAVGKYGIVIPSLVAIAVGIHGLGEGAGYGYTVYQCPGGTPLDCFGGISAGIAYVLHKGLEPMMIGACYSVYVNISKGRSIQWMRDALLLTLMFVIPSLIGAPVGYFIMGPATGFLAGFTATYFFALGTGTSIYAALRLAGPLFKTSSTTDSKDSIKIAVALLLGLITIYLAALFHSG